MTDLFDDQAVSDFMGAIRDVTDTFQRYPVGFGDEGACLTVLCGRKSVLNELLAREAGQSIVQAFKLSLNWQYATEKGLVGDDGVLLIGYDTPVWMDGERFVITKLDESVFRDQKVMVIMEVVC